ncbi:MAG TPA: hypothetical protein VKY65_07785 [Alphaproteobacteria bacterium]|nr:hypothetical protein [Alphaproteobacteria bacterium]
MFLPSISSAAKLAYLSAEYDGESWLFAAMHLFLRPRRLDLAGGEILLGHIAIALGGGGVTSCRAPRFLRFPVAEDGTVERNGGVILRAFRTAIRADREAAAQGIIGANRALLRRRLAERYRWTPSVQARQRFLLQALEMAARPHKRLAGED